MRQQWVWEHSLFVPLKDRLDALARRAGAAIAALGLLFTVTLVAGVVGLIAGCGGGGGDGSASPGAASPGAAVSPQTVSGVAATGSPLVGQVTLRDSSSVRRDKVTVIANDGSFSIDVSDMQSPFLLKATGTADGVGHTLYSFADKPGTANINPLSSVALANAAGVNDPAAVFDKPDPATLDRIKSAMPASVAMLQSKLSPLLTAFDATAANPVNGQVPADHTGLDQVFDNVRVVLANGTLTITNATTGAVLFTAQINDLGRGHFTDNDDDLPKPGPRPAAPTGVKAVGGDGQVTISWDPVANATSYDLYYKTRSGMEDEEGHEVEDEDEDGIKVKNVTSPYVLKGLRPSTTYFFVVRALTSNRRGPASAEVSATTNATTPPPTLPVAPTGVTATGGTKQVTIAWPAVTGATSYNLYWSRTSGVTTANGTKIAGVTSPAVHTGLLDNTTYYYIVTAANSAGEGPASVQVAATTLVVTPPVVPNPPTGVGATGGANQVTLTWPAVTGAASYNVYWSTTAGVTIATGTRIAGVTSPFVHTGLTAGTAYFYIVTAANSAGESGPSAQVSATTNPAVAIPPAPTGVVAVGGSRQVTVSWMPASGATSYNLYWSTTSGVTIATGTKVTGVTSPYVHTGRADGTAYFYIVTAVNASGESVASAQVTAVTTAAIDGVALYNQYCSNCHGPLTASDQHGASAAAITRGIANVASMNIRFNPTTGTLIKLTPEQIAAISTAMQ